MKDHQERGLEYRLDENENKSPEARIMGLGYLDPGCENRQAASPTMTRNTRQLLCSKKDHGWDSLQPRETSVERSCHTEDTNDISGVLPVPELAAALNVDPGDITNWQKPL